MYKVFIVKQKVISTKIVRYDTEIDVNCKTHRVNILIIMTISVHILKGRNFRSIFTYILVNLFYHKVFFPQNTWFMNMPNL